MVVRLNRLFVSLVVTFSSPFSRQAHLPGGPEDDLRRVGGRDGAHLLPRGRLSLRLRLQLVLQHVLWGDGPALRDPHRPGIGLAPLLRAPEPDGLRHRPLLGVQRRRQAGGALRLPRHPRR